MAATASKESGIVPLAALQGLPRASFVSAGLACHDRARTYVATHEGANPPKNQIIGTDTSDAALIRLLTSRERRATETPAPYSKTKTKDTAGGADEPGHKRPRMALDLLLSTAKAPNQRRIEATLQPIQRMDFQTTPKPAPPPGSKPVQPSASSRPAQTPSRAETVGAPAGPAQAPSQTPNKAMYDQEQLRAMAVKDLKDACKARQLQVSGSKDQLVTRIVEYQRRVKRAQLPSSKR